LKTNCPIVMAAPNLGVVLEPSAIPSMGAVSHVQPTSIDSDTAVTTSPKTRLPPLNLGGMTLLNRERGASCKTKREGCVAQDPLRKTHYEDSIRRLHLIQHEERHNVMILAEGTLREVIHVVCERHFVLQIQQFCSLISPFSSIRM